MESLKSEKQTEQTDQSDEEAYLIFTVAEQLFALPYHNLIQIIDVPALTALPNMPGHVRGCIDFMGDAVPMYDARVAMGHEPLKVELAEVVETLKLRKQDHLQWVGKLKDSVNNDKEITLETNPHKCAFGKWYDNFKTESCNLSQYMERFDQPHKEIHQLAIRSEELIFENKKEEAKRIIREAENRELKYLVDLFDGFETQLKRYTHEYALVIDREEQRIAIAIDSVNYFEKFDEINHEVPFTLDIQKSNIVEAIGKKRHQKQSTEVLILNLDKLLDLR